MAIKERLIIWRLSRIIRKYEKVNADKLKDIPLSEEWDSCFSEYCRKYPKRRRKSAYERCKRNDLSRGDKKSGRVGSRSECYRQNDIEI